MHNILTIDLEEWFQVFYGVNIIKREQWDLLETEIYPAVDLIRKILNKKNLKITFFVVAWLAKKHPNIIRRLKNDGHEVASHGFWHEQLFCLPEKELIFDIRISKKILEDCIGENVYGYRAPGFSLMPEMDWVFDLIKDTGYKYDSSFLNSQASAIYDLNNGLIEVQPNSVTVLGSKIPVCGGFFFRLCPLSLYSLYVKHMNSKNTPVVFYTHSWEIKPSKNRLKLPYKKYFIQYFNTHAVEKKFTNLINQFQFLSVKTYLEQYKETSFN